MRFLVAISLLITGFSLASDSLKLETPKPSPTWSQFRGNPMLQGYAGGTLTPSLKLIWTFKTEGAIKSSAILSKTHVYFGSDDGHVYALNRQTGEQAWKFATEDIVEATPLLLGNLIIVGSSDSHMYALKAESGELVWKFKTGDKLLGAANSTPSPSGSGHWVLFGGYDDFLYCLKAETGELVWKYGLESYINGTPAILGETVAVGGCDSNLHIIGLKDGAPRHVVPIEQYVAGSVAIAENRAYFGHYGNQVVSVDLSKGTVDWTYQHKSFPFFSSPALANQFMVIGGRDKTLHCLNRKDGSVAWTFRTRGRIDGSPAICDGKVVVGSEDGRLYLLSLKDGKDLWSYDLGDRIQSSPAVDQGHVYLGANDGVLYAFGPTS